MAQKCSLRCKGNERRQMFSGAAYPVAIVALFALFFSAGVYLYALNRSAVQGYETKRLERDIASYEKENSRLRITEAELRSLSKIAEFAKSRDMRGLDDSVIILEGHGEIALR